MHSLRRTIALAAATIGLLASCNVDDPPSGDVSRFSVIITAFDPEWKIRSIKTIREETGLGLADAKRLVDHIPSVVKTGLERSEADALAARLRAQRMRIQLQAE
jgi:large subunit ribosomal protein L7/L12